MILLEKMIAMPVQKTEENHIRPDELEIMRRTVQPPIQTQCEGLLRRGYFGAACEMSATCVIGLPP
jgi:hypothetical protein